MRELLDSLPHSIKFYAYHDTRFFRPLTTAPRSTPTPSMANSLPPLDASSNVMTCGVWPRGSRHLFFPIRASVARLHLLKTLWLEKIPFPEVPNDHQFGRHDTIDRSFLFVHRRSRPLHIPRELGTHIAPVLHELSTEPRAADMLPTLNSLIF